jgi:hypothetical protein
VCGERVGENDVDCVIRARIVDAEAVSYLTAECDRLVARLGDDDIRRWLLRV